MFSLCWTYKPHLQIEDTKQSQCPLNVECFDHTLYVAAVTENNQQRWARDSYLLVPDSLLMCLSLLPLSLSLQLLSFLEKKGVDSEGILRVPGSQSRIKVHYLGPHLFLSHKADNAPNYFNRKCAPFLAILCLKQQIEKNASRLIGQLKYWHCKMSDVLEQQWGKSNTFPEFNYSWHLEKQVQWDKINNVFSAAAARYTLWYCI